jgi:hypothetical protein
MKCVETFRAYMQHMAAAHDAIFAITQWEKFMVKMLTLS